MNVIPIKPKDPREFLIYKNVDDEIWAIFSDWKSKKSISEITITTKSNFKKIIEKVNYCSKTNAIEIHYYTKQTGSNLPFIATLNGCKLNCFRVLLLEYSKDEIIAECKSDIGSLIHPKTSNGNVIVGNP